MIFESILRVIKTSVETAITAIAANLTQLQRLENHFHNAERWIGSGAVEDSLTPYQITSGNNDFGAEVLILDTGDTPIVAGNTFFDLNSYLPVDLSTTTPYLLRLIWGTGTVGEAETARQYSTHPIRKPGAGQFKSSEVDHKFEKIASGTKVWAKVKNAGNAETVDLLFGLHEY